MDGVIISQLLVILAFLVIAVLLVKGIMSFGKRGKTEIIDFEPTFTEIGATVIDKRIDEGYVGGSKLPHYATVFVLAFETENGEVKEFSVPEEIYCRSYKKQKGTLVLSNGRFFDFGDGENIE